MRSFFALLAVAGITNAGFASNQTSDCRPIDGNIYQFKFKNVTEDGEMNLATLLKDKVVLVVNVATYWGYAYQYPDLNALINKYTPKNPFTILAVPCNQFGLQEPGSKREILQGVTYVRPANGFIPKFPMTNKVDVNGDTAHDMYKYLKASCPKSPQAKFASKHRLTYDPLHSSDIRWNFEKFLIGRNGKPIRRYHSSVTPKELEEDIERALQRSRR